MTCPLCCRPARADCADGVVRIDSADYGCPEYVAYARVKRANARWPVPKRYENATIGFFDLDSGQVYGPSIRQAHKRIEEYMRRFEAYVNGEDKGLFAIITGVNGAGKSHLSAAAVNAARDMGRVAIWVNVADLVHSIKSTYDREDGTELKSEMMDALTGCDLLVLDDLGKDHMTEHNDSEIWRVINRRYHDEKPLIATTNLNAEEICGRSPRGLSLVTRFKEDGYAIRVDKSIERKRPEVLSE